MILRPKSDQILINWDMLIVYDSPKSSMRELSLLLVFLLSKYSTHRRKPIDKNW